MLHGPPNADATSARRGIRFSRSFYWASILISTPNKRNVKKNPTAGCGDQKPGVSLPHRLRELNVTLRLHAVLLEESLKAQ